MAYNAEYDREYRRKNRDRERAIGRAAYARAKAVVEEAKLGRRCKECGFSDPRALDFHHRDPAEKSFGISAFIKSNWNRAGFAEMVKAEIEKCDVLCANCHQRPHHSAITRTGKDNANNRRTWRVKDMLRAIKREAGCKSCREDDPLVLDFHHRSPKEKEFTIAIRPEDKSYERLMAEVAKCDILCANCHRILEYTVLD